VNTEPDQLATVVVQPFAAPDFTRIGVPLGQVKVDGFPPHVPPERTQLAFVEPAAQGTIEK
jgi:hypothetical protein